MKKLFTLFMLSLFVTVGAFADTYEKVVGNQTDWSGEYVLTTVVGENVLAWNGLDAGKNCPAVTLTDGKIVADDLVTITIAALETGGYSVKVNGGENNGKYISSGTSRPGYSNGLKFIENPARVDIEMVSNVLEMKQVIEGSGIMYLLYNNNTGDTNERFRFYKDSNKGNAKYLAPILYKKASAPAGWDGTVTTSMDNGVVTKLEDLNDFKITFNGAKSLALDEETAQLLLQNENGSELYGVWAPAFGSTYSIEGNVLTLGGFMAYPGVTIAIPGGTTKLYIEDMGTFTIDGVEETYMPTVGLAANIAAAAQPFMFTSVSNNGVEGSVAGVEASENGVMYQFEVLASGKALSKGEGVPTLSLLEDASVDFGAAGLVAYEAETAYIRFMTLQQPYFTQPGTYVLSIPEGTFVDAEGTPNAAVTVKWVVIEKARSFVIENVEVGTVTDTSWGFNEKYYTATVKFQKPAGAKYAYSEGLHMELNGENTGVPFGIGTMLNHVVELEDGDEVTLVFKDAMVASTDDPDYEGDIRPAGSYVGTTEITFMDENYLELMAGEEVLKGTYTGSIVLPELLTLGEPVWNLEMNEDGTANLEEDMVNIGVPVSFPNIKLPSDVNPMDLTATISASLYGIPTNGDIMPISGEGEVGDDNGVDGPVTIVEAQLHNAYIDGTGLHANLFPEMLELGNHYGIVINAVTVMNGETVVVELDKEALNSPEIIVVPAKPSLGDIEWGLDNIDYEANTAELSEDMVNIGIPVSFPNIVLPGDVNPMNLTATVSASLYGIPTNGDIMPISGEENVGDENSGVDGPTPIVEAQLHNAVIDATGLHANLFPEMLELGNHYGIVINAVTVMNGEEVLFMYEGEPFNSPEIVVVPVKPSLGDIEWGLDNIDYEANTAEFSEDMVNIGIPVSFPNIILPSDVNPMNLTATVSASLYGIPTNGDIMPISGEENVGDENNGVDGPTPIVEAQLHNAVIDATGLHANLFAEMLEVGNHYGIVINAVTVMDGEEVILEYEGEGINSPEIVVVPAAVVPSFGGVAFNIEEGAEISVDDVHNLAIKMYFPDGTGFEGYAFAGDAMLQKLVEGEWVMVEEGSKVGFTELYSEYAEDMMDAEFAPALFADLLQDAVVGETYRVLAIDYALIDAEGEPVIFESYENPATAPYVTFTVVDVADGISTIKFNVTDVKYNLSGQRVNNAKGIVIMNGKKYMTK